MALTNVANMGEGGVEVVGPRSGQRLGLKATLDEVGGLHPVGGNDVDEVRKIELELSTLDGLKSRDIDLVGL